MRAARLLPLAAAAVALLAPAPAHGAAAWHDADPDDAIPAAARLADATWHGTTLYAVGSETVEAEDGTTTTQPVVYRKPFEGAWLRDTIAGAPAGELYEVAVNNAGAVAVGATATAQPLVVKLDGPIPSASSPWTPVPTPAVMGVPRSVALSSSDGFIGDSLGQLWTVRSGGSIAPGPATTANDSAIAGVAVTGDEAGVAITDAVPTEHIAVDAKEDTATVDARVFELRRDDSPSGAFAASPALAQPADGAGALVAVAARPGVTLAVDRAGWWQPDSPGVWRRRTTGLSTPGLELADVALSAGVSALAGRVGNDGYVLRGDVGQWTAAKVADVPMNAVAVAGAQDVWAVGDGGTVRRFYDKPPDPDPPCTTCNNNGNGNGNGTGNGTGTGNETGTGNGTGTGSGTDTATSTGSGDTTVVPPARQGDPAVYVVEPKRPATKRKPSGKRRRPARLVSGVKVLRRPRQLVITFRLRAPARVAISAKRGRAVVSRARSRTMRAGHRRVVLPFKGKPPTQLRIVVRPLRAKKA